MNTLLAISFWIDRINSLIGRIASWLVLVMIGVGCWNVLGRYIGQAVGRNLSSNALIETQWYLFSVVFLLGAAYTLQQDGHVRVDVLRSRWNGRRKALADLIGSLLFLLPFTALILFFSWKWVLASWRIRETSPDPGGLSRYPIKALVLVSFFFLLLQGISEAIKNWAILTRRRPPEPESPHDQASNGGDA